MSTANSNLCLTTSGRSGLRCATTLVVPVYNEVSTVGIVLDRLPEVLPESQIVVIDDASTDGSSERLASYGDDPRVTIVRHQRRSGKGAAIQSAIGYLLGDVVVFFDADLEYDPDDIPKLVAPLARGEADVVYGSRFLLPGNRFLSRRQQLGNQAVTRIFNLLAGTRLTDVETGAKAMRWEVLCQIADSLREKKFGIEIELTAKLAKIPRIRIVEVPVHYTARGYSQGKKLLPIDGIRACAAILRYTLLKRGDRPAQESVKRGDVGAFRTDSRYRSGHRAPE
jgi:glycosyltransferase involved in cell wall biosynthesis